MSDLVEKLLRFQKRDPDVSFQGTGDWDLDALVDEIERRNMLALFIDPPWDGTDSPPYLEKTATGYQVFVGERGLRHWVETFSDLKDAVRSKLELLSNTAS